MTTPANDALAGLLAEARAADPGTRIELRDRIAAFGSSAVGPVAAWLREPRLAAFAVRVLERLGHDESLRSRVLAALTGPGSNAPLAIERDIDWALAQLGQRRARPASTPRTGRRRPGPVGVVALRSMRAAEVSAAISTFDPAYVRDWDEWLRRDEDIQLFGQILRRWQAARPYSPRWPRRTARHGPPFLEDLVKEASPALTTIRDLRVVDIASRPEATERALEHLWDVFTNLAIERPASEVGITKAVLLLTRGRIGPAMDSEVRRAIGVPRMRSYEEWLAVLDHVAEDIAEFEAREGPLNKAVPARFSRLEYGRLYDMVMGPKAKSRR